MARNKGESRGERIMAKRNWTNRGGFTSYGKTALSASFNVSGIEEFLRKIEIAGKNIDNACKEAVDAAVPIVQKSMIDGAERHRDTGDVVNAIEALKAKQQGDYIYSAIGIDFNKHPEAFEAVFQEYGDGHSPDFPDPFIRPAVDNNRKQINSIIKNTLKKEGIL